MYDIPTSFFYIMFGLAAIGVLATLAGAIWLAWWLYAHLQWV